MKYLFKRLFIFALAIQILFFPIYISHLPKAEAASNPWEQIGYSDSSWGNRVVMNNDQIIIYFASGDTCFTQIKNTLVPDYSKYRYKAYTHDSTSGVVKNYIRSLTTDPLIDAQITGPVTTPDFLRLYVERQLKSPSINNASFDIPAEPYSYRWLYNGSQTMGSMDFQNAVGTVAVDTTSKNVILNSTGKFQKGNLFGGANGFYFYFVYYDSSGTEIFNDLKIAYTAVSGYTYESYTVTDMVSSFASHSDVSNVKVYVNPYTGTNYDIWKNGYDGSSRILVADVIIDNIPVFSLTTPYPNQSFA